MSWVSRRLRGERVWVHVDAGGALRQGSDGRVEILYKKGGKVYRASPRNLEPDPAEESWTDAEAAPGQVGRSAQAAAAPAQGPAQGEGGAYYIWADGACTGNPGPAGIGVVIQDSGQREEISEYLGQGTNNIAELTAIIRALEQAPRERTVMLYSDSAYALGLLGKNWKAKANQALVERMRTLAAEFRDLRLFKVAGHAGVVENERADALARMAVATRSSGRTVSTKAAASAPHPPGGKKASS